ncbi:MAG TPA: hypothetical protein VLR52_05135, partial [Bacteroidales bacterium]|nr:hypothetical protein [Bacteroidales bacterium]
IPAPNPDFALFTVGSDIPAMLVNAPPLITPFGNYQFSPAADVLFYQKIGSVQSRAPQILFIQSPGKKIGIIAGENLWKWRLSDFQQHENHLAFDELTDKIVQFLAVKGDKSFFRIRVNNRFMENENVEMDGEVYNESYELINTPDVNITISDEQGKKYPLVFGKTEKGYHLNAGSFPVGNYSYSADVKVGKTSYRKQGEFFVAPVNLEALNTIADHSLLFRIATAHDGKMLYPANMQDLVKLINAREDIKPVSYIQKRYNDLLGNVLVFLLILGLLSAEWFIRKRSGSY